MKTFFLFMFSFLFLSTGILLAQPADIPYHIEPYELESGFYNGSNQAGNIVEVFSGVVRVDEFPWLQLHFSKAKLGRESYIIITSLKDDKWQKLDAVTIEQWNNYSAFFNGDAVEIQLFAAPFDTDVFVNIDEITVGDWATGSPYESICGTTDDRISSNQPATGRLYVNNGACTAWIIPNGKFVSAGRILEGFGTPTPIMQFQVPPSLPGGTVQHPGPEDMYSVDVSTIIYINEGIGNDWGVFEVFPNSVTGLMPKEAQGAYWPLQQDLGPNSIRITGYGQDDGVANQTQQTHIGPNAGSSGTTMRYVTDTRFGNLGSPVINELTGVAVGVHTLEACNSSGGNNSGTSTFNAHFWAAVDQGTAGCPTVEPPSNPTPVHKTSRLSLNLTELSWANGAGAVTNELYFGSDPGSLSLVQSGSLATSWTITGGSLEYSTTYYWQVVEIGATCNKNGPLWSFRTEADPSDIVFFDDFESGIGQWTVTLGGSCSWEIFYPPYPNNYTLPAPSSGGVLAADSDNCGNGTTMLTTATIVPIFDLSTCTDEVWIEFDNDWNVYDEEDEAHVEVSTDGGSSWIGVWDQIGLGDIHNSHEVIDVTALLSGQSNVSVRVRTVQPGWDWWWVLDNFSICGKNYLPSFNLPRVRLKIFPDDGTVTRIKLTLVNDYLIPADRKVLTTRSYPISGNEVTLFSNALTPHISSNQDAGKIDRIDLLDAGFNIVGHISFNYTAEDFNANRMVDALLYVHTYQTNSANYPDWEYYSSNQEKMVSMLIPPYESYDAINYNKSLLLLVHGVDGEYPYWGGTSFVNDLSNTYDSWQLYYPYNQEIESSGLLLRDALGVLLQTGPLDNDNYSDRARIVAHSMGGLVTRSYIQSSNYQNDIYKLVMLGTPNYGSYSVYRLRNEPNSIASLIATNLGSKDEDSPAYKQMIPGSEFIYNLNTSSPRQPDPPLSIDKSYLVIAGTLDGMWDEFHTEIKNQEDGVVAVSSASLLNFGIPLATVYLPHTKFPLRPETYLNLRNSIPPGVITEVFSPGYDPNSPSGAFLAGIDGWWGPAQTTPPTIGPIDDSRGIMLLKIPGLEIGNNEYIEIEKKENTLVLQVYDTPNFEGRKVLHRGEDEYNYFSENKSFRNEIGWGFPEGIYSLKFEFPYFSSNWWTWGRAIVIQNALHFKHLQSTMAVVYLSSAALTILNAKSRIQPTPIALNPGESDQLFVLRKRNINNQKVQLTSEYLVDSSVDSVTFIMNGLEGGGFENHELQLMSPTGQLIDSIYAQSDPNIDFSQDILNGIAYYFVRNPEQGIWQVSQNDTMTGAFVSAPIATDFNINVGFIDSLHSVGQVVDLEIPLPQPIDYTNIQITGNVFRSISGSDTLILIEPVNFTLDPGGLKYIGQFTPSLAGTYFVGVNFSCLRSSELITRNLLAPFSVSAIAAPELVLPLENQNVLGDSVQLYWSTSPSANFYRLQVIVPTDTIPFLDQGFISDTSYSIALSVAEEIYFWKVQAINTTDSSAWSELRSFTSLTPISSVTVNVISGWNMISNPVTRTANTDSVQHLFPNSLFPYAFRFDPSSGYQQESTMENGPGYWAKFPEAETNFIYGESRIVDSIQVSAGWNMMGSISNPVDTSTIISVPPGIRSSNWFGFSGGYIVANQITPGLAYWVKVNSGGKFVLSATDRMVKTSNTNESPTSQMNKITITDGNGSSQTLFFGSDPNNEINTTLYEMPPLPPAGIFDARFHSNEGGLILQTYPAKIEGDIEFPIVLQLDTYPISVSWDIKDESIYYELNDGVGGKIFNSRELVGQGTMKLTGVENIFLKVSGENQLPTEFDLSQNYPNPFNPSTTIKFALPQDSKVNLTVFNILGEEVAKLINQEMKAGYHQIEFNASTFASGVYLYRIKAGDFIDIKKMILLK